LSSDGFCESWGNRISYLAKTRGGMTGELEPIWECLDASGLPNRERAVLARMDVPVPITRDMRSDRPAQATPFEPFVFVVEDVCAVALQLLREVFVCPAGLQ
jgi:hypothetical protein